MYPLASGVCRIKSCLCIDVQRSLLCLIFFKRKTLK
uniref:Uncharacterized protein n=2 Tax=Anguilla anguilla TaxID=7936 RepID=A0A0E9QL02_ANGAN